MNPKEYAQMKLQQPTQQPARIPQPQEQSNIDFLNRIQQLQNAQNKAGQMQQVKQNQAINAMPANRPSVYNPNWGANVKTN